MSSLFLTSLLQQRSFRLFMLSVSLSLPVTPVMAIDFTSWVKENIMGEKPKDAPKPLTKEEQEKQAQEEQEVLKQTAVRMLGNYALTLEDQAAVLADCIKKGGNPDQIKIAIANELKNGLHQRSSIMTEHERKELDLEWLLTKIDRTQTSLGRWGLQQTFYPTDDLNQIKIQQARVKALVEDPDLFASVEKLLATIKKHEKSMIIYWQGGDNAQSLYYKFGLPFLGDVGPFKLLNRFLNNNRFTLEFSSLWAIGLALKNVALNFFLIGLWEEFMSASESENHVFDPIRGLTRGVRDFKNYHNPFRSEVTTTYKNTDIRDENGHLRQRDARGNPIIIDENGLPKVFIDPENGNPYTKAQGYVQTKESIARAMWHGTSGDKYYALSRGLSYRIPILNIKVPAADETPAPFPFVFKVSALAGVAAITILRDLWIFNSMKDAVDGLKNTIEVTADLRDRMFDVADYVKATQEIAQVIASHNVFAHDCMTEHMAQVFAPESSTSKEFKECLALLKTDTFKRVSTLGAKHIAYSRGRMLLTNRLFMKHKNEMLPALRAIAELDAAFSMARLYKEHLNTNAPFAFVEFITAPSTTIELRDVWMPFFGDKDPVRNDILLGGNFSQRNWLVTGPNGGGKLQFLKQGIPIALAQSWGMVPAHSARMTIVNGLRTSTNAKENMREGESTFMAECRAMERLYSFINEETEPTGKYIVIADEPYRGTVNDETARRTGAFCDAVSAHPQVTCIVATHIMPVMAPGTQSSFSFWQVGISEPTVGQFIRNYKLSPD